MSDWKWLATTRELQTKSYGVDPHSLEGDELADFVAWNVTALVSELGEFLEEVKWKPWVTERGMGNREAAIGELVDAGHFLANLLSAMRCTDDTWALRYQAKQQVNRDRMRSQVYDGVSTKCPNCKRDLLETGRAIYIDYAKMLVKYGCDALPTCAGATTDISFETLRRMGVDVIPR